MGQVLKDDGRGYFDHRFNARIINVAPGGQELASAGIITNNFELEAITIAEIYRYRWQIELFFKKLKQNFQLQYFVGDNQNAIEIQIWCALIAVLLLTVIHQHNKSKMAFSNVTTLLRIHLAGYIGIKEILALHNKKRERGKPQIQVATDLFSET